MKNPAMLSLMALAASLSDAVPKPIGFGKDTKVILPYNVPCPRCGENLIRRRVEKEKGACSKCLEKKGAEE